MKTKHLPAQKNKKQHMQGDVILTHADWFYVYKARPKDGHTDRENAGGHYGRVQPLVKNGRIVYNIPVVVPENSGCVR